jgi:hypothetical protein
MPAYHDHGFVARIAVPATAHRQGARRVMSRGPHIAGNPDVIVQNMPGAASLKSVLYLDTTAPRDGTVIATFNFGQIGDSRMMPEKVKVDFRPFIASSMVPAERIELIRAAFDETMKDREFIAGAAKIRMPLAPKSGAQALRAVAEIYATPDDIVQAARKIAGE